MSNFITINKLDDKGRIAKYDNYRTEAEAQARVEELHRMGLTDAFYVDADATATDGHLCFQRTQAWAVNPVAKTVTLDRTLLNAEIKEKDMRLLRKIRNKLLKASDIKVLPDRWATMDDATKAKWTAYRQELRDLPETVVDPENPVWPEAQDDQ